MRPMTLSTQLVQCHGRQTLSVQATVDGKLQGRYGAAKSLDILRLNIQGLVNKEIDAILKKYLDKFFQPAIVNIRKNLGEDSVTEQSLHIVCIDMLEDAKSQYRVNTPAKNLRTQYYDNTQISSQSLGAKTPYNSPQPMVRAPVSSGNLFLDGSHYGDLDGSLSDTRLHLPPQSPSNLVYKRKETDSDTESGRGRKKVLRTVTSILPGAPTPIKLVKLEGIKREGPKWDPNRINSNTLFIMGARANKVLGFGQTRGRLYTKHPELLKYSGDTEDKEWLSRNNLMPPTGGIAYLLVLEDIKELAESDDYRHNPNVLLHELRGFHAPDFMLTKIRTFISQARTVGPDNMSYQYYDPNLFLQGINQVNYASNKGSLADTAPVNSMPSPCDITADLRRTISENSDAKSRQTVPGLTALYTMNRPETSQLEYF